MKTKPRRPVTDGSFLLATFATLLALLVGAVALGADKKPEDLARAEREALLSPTRSEIEVIAPRTLRFAPAFTVWDETGKRLLFSEWNGTAKCPANNLWERRLEKDRFAAPTRLAEFPCLEAMRVQHGRVFLQYRADGFQRWREAGDLARKISGKTPRPDLVVAATSEEFLPWKFRFDLWEDAPDKAISFASAQFLSLGIVPKERIDAVVVGGKEPSAFVVRAAFGGTETTPELVVEPFPALPDGLSFAEYDRASALYGDDGRLVLLLSGHKKGTRLARVVEYQVEGKTLAPKWLSTLGGDEPYVGADPWEKLDGADWAARDLLLATPTPGGYVFADGTPRRNEWPAVSYYSPHLPRNGKAELVRIPRLDGANVIGLSAYQGGLLVSELSQRRVIWIGRGNPFPGVKPKDAGDKEGRDEEKRNDR